MRVVLDRWDPEIRRHVGKPPKGARIPVRLVMEMWRVNGFGKI
jgi:hypothetical protein